MKRLILISALALGTAALAASAAYNLAHADESLSVPAPPQPPVGARLLNRETAPLRPLATPPADAALAEARNCAQGIGHDVRFGMPDGHSVVLFRRRLP